MINPLALFFIICTSLISPLQATVGLNFKEAFLKIKAQDPRMKAQGAELNSAQTDALASKLTFLPTLSATAQRRWQGTINSIGKVDSVSGVAALNLFAFGRDYYTLKSSTKGVKAQEFAYKQVELDVEKEIFTSLLNLILAKENVLILEEIEGLKTDLLEVSKARFKRGLDPSSELLRAQVEVANASAKTQSARSELSLALAALKSLSDTEISISDSWPLNPKMRKERLERLKKQDFSIDQRPDFQKALNTLEAVSYQKKSIFSEYFPTLDFSVARTYTENYFNQWDTTYLLSLNFPIFSGGATLAKRDQLEATRMRSESNLTITRRSAPQNFESQLSNLTRGHQTLEARLETLGLSTKLYQENLSLFKAGRRPLFELLLDQERMLTSKQLANLGQRDFYGAMMNVCLELGRTLENCLFLK